jgi:hypothetical protein
VVDVKLQSPVSPDKIAGREGPARTGSRFAELKLEAVWRKNLCNLRYTCAESSFRSIFRPTPKQFHNVLLNVLARWRELAHVQFSSMLRTDAANSEKRG